MEAPLIKNGTAQQKSTVTLTLIHAAHTPPCIDLPLKRMYSTALAVVTYISNISPRGPSKMITGHLQKSCESLI